MKRRNLSGIFIFDKLEGEEKPTPTCLEDCTPETRLKWNTSDEETDDSTWIGEFDLRATYGVGFVESLPDIANGEMTEIRIKYTAEKCE